MKTSLHCASVFEVLVICLVPILGRADEPKVAVKKAVEAQPTQVEPKAVKKAEAKKPEQPRKGAVP